MNDNKRATTILCELADAKSKYSKTREAQLAREKMRDRNIRCR